MLPYSNEVLFALFAEFNRSAWPAALLFQLLGVVVIILLHRFPGRRGSARWVSAILAGAWGWVGVGFHWWHFAAFNFAASWYGAVFLFQGVLFAWAALDGKPRYRWRAGGVGWIGQAMVLYALAGYPLVDWWLGRDWQGLRLFAMAPGPTMLFTLGALLLVQWRVSRYLFAIPFLWGLAGGFLAWLSGLPQDAVLPIASLLGLGAAAVKNHRA